MVSRVGGACSVTQLCPALCDPKDCSPSGYVVHGIFQARTVDCHFLLQDIPDPGIKPASLEPQALAAGFFITAPPGKPMVSLCQNCPTVFKLAASFYIPSSNHKCSNFSTSLLIYVIFYAFMAILVGRKLYLIVALIYISPMTNDFEHLLMCFLAICVSLGKYLFTSFAYVLI